MPRPLLVLLLFVAATPACSETIGDESPSQLAAPCAQDGPCGCWSPADLKLEVTVTDSASMPLAGVTLECPLEPGVLATSDAGGRMFLELSTRRSTTCGWATCASFTLRDPRGRVQARDLVTPLDLEPVEVELQAAFADVDVPGQAIVH